MASFLQNNLRRLLAEKDLSVSSLEKKAGLKPSTVQNIIQGRSKSPRVDIMYAIAQQLGCTVEELFAEEIIKEVESSKPQLSDGKELPWDSQLFIECTKYLESMLKDRKLELTYEQALSFLEATYSYSISTQNKNLDGRFAQWFFDHHFKNLD